MPLEIDLENNFLDKMITAGTYQPPLSTLVTTLKYQSIRDIGLTLGRIIYNCVDFPVTDFITAVPIHKKRRKERGFNQAEIIARELSRLSKTPYKEFLIRTKHSKPQASLSDKSKRLIHLENTFALNNSPNFDKKENLLAHKSILLIDDVTTTGTTLNKCAQILKNAEAREVIGLTVAHE